MGSGQGKTRRAQVQTQTVPALKGNIYGRNLIHGEVDYDCFFETDPDQHQRCLEEGICRCRTIEVEVKGFSEAELANSWTLETPRAPGQRGRMKKQRMETIDQYGIKRIIAGQKLQNDDFEVETSHGYYGEEIDRVVLTAGKAADIDQAVKELFTKKTLKEKVEYLLEREEGYILPLLRGKQYKVEVVDLAEIRFGAVKHYQNLEPEMVQKYEEEIDEVDLFGVVLRSAPSHYQLIDGYHRCRAAQNKKKKSIPVIVAY